MKKGCSFFILTIFKQKSSTKKRPGSGRFFSYFILSFSKYCLNIITIYVIHDIYLIIRSFSSTSVPAFFVQGFSLSGSPAGDFPHARHIEDPDPQGLMTADYISGNGLFGRSFSHARAIRSSSRSPISSPTRVIPTGPVSFPYPTGIVTVGLPAVAATA